MAEEEPEELDTLDRLTKEHEDKLRGFKGKKHIFEFSEAEAKTVEKQMKELRKQREKENQKNDESFSFEEDRNLPPMELYMRDRNFRSKNGKTHIFASPKIAKLREKNDQDQDNVNDLTSKFVPEITSTPNCAPAKSSESNNMELVEVDRRTSEKIVEGLENSKRSKGSAPMEIEAEKIECQALDLSSKMLSQDLVLRKCKTLETNENWNPLDISPNSSALRQAQEQTTPKLGQKTRKRCATPDVTSQVPKPKLSKIRSLDLILSNTEDEQTNPKIPNEHQIFIPEDQNLPRIEDGIDIPTQQPATSEQKSAESGRVEGVSIESIVDQLEDNMKNGHQNSETEISKEVENIEHKNSKEAKVQQSKEKTSKKIEASPQSEAKENYMKSLQLSNKLSSLVDSESEDEFNDGPQASNSKTAAEVPAQDDNERKEEVKEKMKRRKTKTHENNSKEVPSKKLKKGSKNVKRDEVANVSDDEDESFSSMRSNRKRSAEEVLLNCSESEEEFNDDASANETKGKNGKDGSGGKKFKSNSRQLKLSKTQNHSVGDQNVPSTSKDVQSSVKTASEEELPSKNGKGKLRSRLKRSLEGNSQTESGSSEDEIPTEKSERGRYNFRSPKPLKLSNSSGSNFILVHKPLTVKDLNMQKKYERKLKELKRTHHITEAQIATNSMADLFMQPKDKYLAALRLVKDRKAAEKFFHPEVIRNGARDKLVVVKFINQHKDSGIFSVPAHKTKEWRIHKNLHIKILRGSLQVIKAGSDDDSTTSIDENENVEISMENGDKYFFRNDSDIEAEVYFRHVEEDSEN